MKKFVIAFLLLLPGCVGLGDQKTIIVGSDWMVKQERSVQGVHGIDVTGGVKVFLSQGDTESLVIEADDNLLPYIKSDMVGNTLQIKTDDTVRLQSIEAIFCFIVVKKIEKIALRGDVELITGHLEKVVKPDQIKANKLEIDVSGSSRIDATIDVKELEVELSGSTQCNLQGNAEKQKVEIFGSGFYNAAKLVSKKSDIEVSGAARIMVNVTDDLKVDASGAAFIGYTGDPTVRKKVSGAVTIQKVG